MLLDEADTGKAASDLVRLALHRGGTDNITVVVLDVLSGEEPAATDDIVLIPVAVPGKPAPASGTETSATTEAVVPRSSAVPMTTTPLGTQALPSPDAAPRAAHSRPILLVPRAKRPKGQRDRILTIRVALFVLVFAAVLGGTAGVVVWFDKASFFVGLDQGHVTIFQGRPGGLLWLKPSVVERTALTPPDLLASNVVYLRQGMEESSYQAARNLVHDLSLERTRIVPNTSATTTTSPRAVTATTTLAGVVTPPTATATAGPKPHPLAGSRADGVLCPVVPAVEQLPGPPSLQARQQP